MSSCEVFHDSFITPTRFQIVLDDPAYKNLSFKCQTINIPTVSVQQIDTPFRQFKPVVTGSAIKFEPFEAKFILDETLSNYRVLYQWLVDQVNSDKTEAELSRNVSLFIYNSSNVVAVEFIYHNAFPTSLSPLQFNVTESETIFMVADISFAFDYYTIKTHSS